MDRPEDVAPIRLPRLPGRQRAPRRRSARRWRWLGAAGLGLAIAVACLPAGERSRASTGPGAPAPAPGQADPADSSATVEALRDLASRSLDMIERSFERGVAESRLADAAYRFSYRLLSSELYLGLPEGGPRTLDPELYLSVGLAPASAERLAAFQAHRDRMLRWEQRFRPLARDRIVSPLAFAELQARLLEAEAMAARERLRLAGADPSPPPP